VTPEQRGDLERIRAGQQQLLAVIDDVLAYTKLEAGILHFAVDDVPLDELLTGCCALVGHQARQKKIEVRRTGSVSGLAVRADSEKVQQVVLKLLNNAIKFTDPGGAITIAWQELRDERIGITVSDTGRGIAASDLECVFQPFVQVDAKLTRAQDGAGLGLAIGRQLARRMGGDLTVASDVGAGSRFTLTLACGRQTDRAPE
jgi:signal transduction histidine kinase